ncbi:MAG: YciI family protein [Alphaproteobacteria bacterium]
MTRVNERASAPKVPAPVASLNRPSFGIPLAREQCYVCWMSAPDNPPPMPKSPEKMRMDHHRYLVDLERKGVLFAAGPFVNEKGVRVGVGMLLIRARTTAEATRIAMREPYTRAGQRIMTVTPWQRNEGTLRLSLNLADGELKVDSRSYTIAPKGR